MKELDELDEFKTILNDLKVEYILIGILFIIVVYLYLYKDSNKPNIVDKSTIEGTGRGVFASKDYNKGDIIEECPMVVEEKPSILEKTIMGDYYWTHERDKQKGIIALGLCSLYNHADDNNVNNNQDNDKNLMIFKAKKSIKKGEEMFINYGKNYWNYRN
jgi:uncharacterized protein